MQKYWKMAAAVATSAMLSVGATAALAQDYTITVWSGGSGPNDNYRIDAIKNGR